MTCYLILNRRNELVSSGTVVADPLPKGLRAVEITEAEYDLLQAGAATWDRKAKALVAVETPLHPLEVRIAELEERLEALDGRKASSSSSG